MKLKTGRIADLNTLEVEGVNTADWPDLCDSFFSAGETEDGEPLTDAELEEIQEAQPDLLYELAVAVATDPP